MVGDGLAGHGPRIAVVAHEDLSGGKGAPDALETRSHEEPETPAPDFFPEAKMKRSRSFLISQAQQVLRRCAAPLCLALTSDFLAGTHSQAAVFLAQDDRLNRVMVEVGPTPGTCFDEKLGPGDFSFWGETATCDASDPFAPDCSPGSARASSAGQFTPTFFQFDFEIYGGGDEDCSMKLSAHAYSLIKFTVTSCQEYSIFGGMVQGDGGEAVIGLNPYVENGNTISILDFRETTPSFFVNGRLGPGDYEIGASSRFDDVGETTVGPSGSYGAFFADCLTTFILVQPTPLVCDLGQSAQFSVQAAGTPEAAVLTYQWRKNLTNLTNGGRISGATSPTLTIANVQADDVAFYSVVVSNGAITEPSSYAPLNLSGATSVDAEGSAEIGLQLLPPSPNPFDSSTTLRYHVSETSAVRLEIFDVRGRRVRTLVDQPSSSPGTYETTWRGEDQAGARSASGVYFVRLQSGSRQEMKRLVLRTN